MGDRIAVMKLGVLQQVGSPEELYEEPANVFVAGFIGSPAMNLVPAPVLDGVGGDDRIAGFRPEHIDVGQRRGRRHRFDGHGRGRRVPRRRAARASARARTRRSQAKLPVEEKLDGRSERRPSPSRADKLYLFDAETEDRIRA